MMRSSKRVILTGLSCLMLSWVMELEGVSLAPKRYGVKAAGRELQIPYQGSHPLEGEQAQVRRVVVAVHSSNYRPQDAYNAVVIAMGGHTGAADEVCIVAPQFLESAELPASVPDDLLYWNSFPFRGTSSGRFGPSAQSVSISVFEVMDRLLLTLTDPLLFPNLETVVVVGHSAGGQLVNRYAITGRFESEMSPAREIHVRYMVLAPSSYLYFTPERDADGDGIFLVPAGSELAACPGYDDYGYGLQALYSYPAETGVAVMREQYPKRFVFYLVGALDNDPADSSLATDCESMVQGPHRLARMSTYFNHLQEVFGPEILKNQTFTIVPGAGHSYSGQLNSVPGKRYLLDIAPEDTDRDGQTDWGEWIAGTDANDGSDYFRTGWQVSAVPGEFELVWPALPGRRYRIMESNNPAAGFSQAGLRRQAAGGDPMRWSFTPGNTPKFYVILAELD